MFGSSVHDLLASEGYRLVEDAWTTHGRRTYLHDETADRSFLADIARILRGAGWVPDSTVLRAFRNGATGEFIEIEPGGADTTGHFLHVVRAGDTLE